HCPRQDRSAPARWHERNGAHRNEPHPRRAPRSGERGVSAGWFDRRLRPRGRCGQRAAGHGAATRPRSARHPVWPARGRANFAERPRRGGRQVKRWAAAGLALAVIGAATALLWARFASNGRFIPTAHAQRGPVHMLAYAKGDLRALRAVPLMVPPIGGLVTIVDLAPSGTAVKAGDLIVAFDPSE